MQEHVNSAQDFGYYGPVGFGPVGQYNIEDWVYDNRGTIATVLATAGCFVPGVGQLGCAGLQVAAFGVRSEQSLSANEGDWNEAGPDIAVDVAATLFGIRGLGGLSPTINGLDDLAARRTALGAPPAGPGVSPTLARLDVDGMASIYGTSGHGQPVSLIVNPISRTHAETDVLQQLANRGGAQGASATLYIDYPLGLCGACGRSGAVSSMARQVGISELTVVWPGGSTVMRP